MFMFLYVLAIVVHHPQYQAFNGVGAAYMEIESEDADELIGVSSPDAQKAELHDHIIQHNRARMVHIPSIVVNKKVVLKSGGLHIMLFGVRETPIIRMTLIFKSGKKIDIECKKREIGGHRCCK